VSQDVDKPDQDADWNEEYRNESLAERLDRNWDDLLQELRVAQTGVQLLTGLLLTVPFQQRFHELAAHQRTVYIITFCLSVLATGLLASPVVLHRVLFRQHARRMLVSAGQRFTLAGFTTLGLAIVGVVTLIFDVVFGLGAAITAGIVAFIGLSLLWAVGPLAMRQRLKDRPDPAGQGE
jgi:hypothetical protein